MITIYGVYRSRATRNIWLLNELGVPFEHVPVIQANRVADPLAADAPLNTRSPAFLAVNPNGRVPALKDGDLVLCESLAMNLYIARKHGGPLAPATLAEDGECAMWTLWAATEAEPHAILVLYHRVMKQGDERKPELADAAVEALRAPFRVLDAALAKTGFLVGGRFTVADINVAEVVRYAGAAPELFVDAPHVKAWLAACHARPAFTAMMEKRNAEPA
ncbi:Gst Glutathione S-transferase [Rhabdaerophilaceae bacterium]